MEHYLSVVGGVFLAYHGLRFGLQVVNGIRTFILPSLGVRKDLSGFGRWAVVTGCTDGIGKSYAKLLAQQGINIVLISRNLDKLQATEEEIKSLYKVDTLVIVMDFSDGPEHYGALEGRLKGLDIGILVNNVGVGDTCPDTFHLKERQETLTMLNVNILSVVMMSYIVLPGMVSRNKGLVINVSSLSGAIPMPLISTYSSTKAFVDFFSRCLNTEYSDKGITVQCVMPGFVSTNMTKRPPSSIHIPSSDDFVRQALGTIGVESRTYGYWNHSLKAWFVHNLIPDWLRDMIVWKVWAGIRANVQRKRRQREEKQKLQHND